MIDREGLEKLAPCPFCGVTPTLGVLHRDGGFSPKDGGNVVHHGDEECPAEGFHILEVWNRRSSPPPADQNKQIAEAHGIDLATLSDPPPPAEPVGLGTFARTAAILAAEPDPGLRASCAKCGASIPWVLCTECTPIPSTRVEAIAMELSRWRHDPENTGYPEEAARICALFEGAGGGLLASTVLAWLKERGGESWKATIRDVEYAIENLRSSPLAVASPIETPLSDAAKGYLGRMADEKATRASPPPAEACQGCKGTGEVYFTGFSETCRMCGGDGRAILAAAPEPSAANTEGLPKLLQEAREEIWQDHSGCDSDDCAAIRLVHEIDAALRGEGK